MKKTIILASVAIATLFAFSSCQKENLESNYSANGLRIITAEFENNATKTTLNSDGKTPEWEEGDVIRVLNGSTHQDVEIISGNGTPESGKAYISGSGLIISIPAAMTGTLYAVYPASATTMTNCSGSIGFTIPSTQDGTFASANICVAKGDDKDNLTFRNATAVLKITTATDVVGVKIEATNNIAGSVTASFSGDEISLTPSLTGKTVSAVGTTAPTGNVFYLAAAPGSTGSTTATCYSIDKKGSTDKGDKELLRNVIYAMNLSEVTPSETFDLTGTKGELNGHEYVIIKAKYDGRDDSYLKWATMNVGATAVTGTGCYGRYFMWGETTGIVPNGSGFTFPDSKYYDAENSTWDNTQCFVSENCPWTNDVYNYDIEGGKKVFTKYVPTSESSDYWNGSGSADNKTTLDPEDDAASVNWGGTWRMPKGSVNVEDPGDFKALKEATYWKWDSEDGGFYVYVPQPGDNGKVNNGTGSYEKANALLFFPAAGYSHENSSSLLEYEGERGYYWSKNLWPETPVSANYLEFNDYALYPSPAHPRYYGCSIRPVSD